MESICPLFFSLPRVVQKNPSHCHWVQVKAINDPFMDYLGRGVETPGASEYLEVF